MRRTLLVIALIASLCVLTLRPSPASADVNHTATCAFTSYNLSGSFNRLGGATTFTLDAVGSCVGTGGTNSVIVSISYNSIGSWSCDAGVAHGAGRITPNSGVTRDVDSYLVNVGGEYVIEVLGSGAVAAGQLTTLPIACDLGTTQTTIGGTGTLTFTA